MREFTDLVLAGAACHIGSCWSRRTSPLLAKDASCRAFPSLARLCHPEAPFFGAEGSMRSPGATGADNESIDPSARKERGPQDDKGVFGALGDRNVRFVRASLTTIIFCFGSSQRLKPRTSVLGTTEEVAEKSDLSRAPSVCSVHFRAACCLLRLPVGPAGALLRHSGLPPFGKKCERTGHQLSRSCRRD